MKGGEHIKKIVIKTKAKTVLSNQDDVKTAQEIIREAYTVDNGKPVVVIPAKPRVTKSTVARKLRVCAYCRVSTASEMQASSYELQYQYYSEKIKKNPEWEFVGIYADRGLSGTSVKKRDQFLRMIDDCAAGKIDKILVKHLNRFSRNVEDCLHYTRLLKGLPSPVSVYFESQHIDSLTETSESQIIFASMIAQGESESKSISLKWSNRNRFQKGIIYPTWSLLGYIRGPGRQWIIENRGAEIVSAIFTLYLEGYSTPRIARILTQSGIETPTGQEKWSSGSIIGILRNEKYCGDALCQKTVTTDLFEHKTAPNDGIVDKFFHEKHHIPIVSKRDWLRVQKLLDTKHYTKNRVWFSKPHTVRSGSLAGFTIIDPSWDDEVIEKVFFKKRNHLPISEG